MTSIAGIWKPIYKQATFNETSFRHVKENSIATIVISEDGTNDYMERRKMFGRVVRTRIIVLPLEGPNSYFITQPEEKLGLHAIIDEDGRLVTIWHSNINAINGMAVVYEKQ